LYFEEVLKGLVTRKVFRLVSCIEAKAMVEKTVFNKLRFFFLYFITGFFLFIMLPQSAVSDLVDESFLRLPVPTEVDTGYSVATGDVDGNDSIDFVTARQAGLQLMLNNGSGIFQAASEGSLPVSLSTQTIISVQLADLDGDTDLDLILANGSGYNFLLINNGSGRFQDETSARMPVNSAISVAVSVADIDSDGDKDLIIANRNAANTLLINNGSGVFSDVTQAQLGTDSEQSNGLLLFDANADGSKDLLVLNEKNIRLFINNGLGAFVDKSSIQLPGIQFGGIAAQSVDIENDGDQDVVVAAAAMGARLLVNDGTGVFSDETSTLLPENSDFTIKVAIEDIDFDGLSDILLANAGQDRVLINEGNGHFANSGLLAVDDLRSFGAAVLDIEDDFDVDALLTTSKGTDRLFVNNIGVPRIRLQVSPNYIETGDNTTITVNVFDEDGIASDSLDIQEPDGANQNLTLSLGTAVFVPTQVGEHIAVYSATDTEGNSNSRQKRFTVLAADILAPTILLDVTKPSPLLLGGQVNIATTATDDRGVVDISVDINGQNIPLDNAGNVVYVATAIGVHNITVFAHDAAGNEGTTTAQFTVDADTETPIVTLEVTPLLLDVAQTVSFQITASDNVAIDSQTLSLVGPGITGSQNVSLNVSGQGSYIPYQPGIYTATFQAIDPSGNSSETNVDFEVEGIVDLEVPIVDIQISASSIAIGGTVTLQVNASDNVAISSKRLEINGTPVTLDVSGSVTYTPPVIGVYNAVAYAADFSTNEGTSTKTFKVVDPASDNTAPEIDITSPIEDEDVGGSVQVFGTATDETFVSYTLAYAPVGTNNFIDFVSGNEEVVDGLLGTFDTSLLENGFYEVRLSATDVNGLTSYLSVVISVSGDLKLGQFAISFQDKNLNLGKLPVTVTRAYDSRKRATVGDFGYGWDVSFTDVKVTQNRIIGLSWQTQSQGGFIPQYALVPTKPHTVSIKFGANQEFKFVATPSPETQAFNYQYIDGFNFDPIGDTKGTLVPIAASPFIYSGGAVLNFDFEIYNPTGYVYTSEDGFIYRFGGASSNLRFQLTSVTDPNGVTVQITPNGFQRSDGLSVAFVRDGAGRISRLTDPEGNAINYEYDVDGNLSAVIDAELNRTEFIYDANHFLTEIKDPLGRPAQRQEYDDGRLTAITDATGQRIEMEYDPTAQTQIVRDRRGNPVIYEYDNAGNVTRQTEFPTVNGAVKTIETLRAYDSDNQLVSEMLPNGMKTLFSYSAKGNLLSRVIDSEGLQISETFTYDGASRVLTSTDAKGSVITNAYDSKGRLVSKTARTGEITAYEYDANGNRTRLIDPNGDYTAFEYDTFGNKLTEERFDLNNNSIQRKEFTYSANGSKLSESLIVLKGGVSTALTTFFEYNKNGLLISEIDPLANEKIYEHDSVGNKVAEIDKEGNKTSFFYDSTGNLVKKTFPDSSVMEYLYDVSGNRTSIIDKNLRTTNFEYDALNRLIKTVFSDGASRANLYDEVGNAVALIDELGNRTDHQYDAVGRRIKTIQPLAYDSLQDADIRAETAYVYDANNNKISVTDANGNSTSYQYDKQDRLTVTEYSDGNTEMLEYDLLGSISKKTDPSGLSTLNEYDSLGRLVKVTLPAPDGIGDKPITTYQFDKAGNMLVQIDANSNATLFEYDDVGNKLSRELPGGEKETFIYDANGRVVGHTDFIGNLTQYTYNPVGRVISVLYDDGSAVETTYAGGGQRLTVTDSRGVTSNVYDSRNRIQRVTSPTGQVVSYTYDLSGKQSSVVTADSSTTYTYDALQRISSSTDSTGNVSAYTYDAVGNLTTVDYPNGTQANYIYSSRNQLLSLQNVRSDSSVINGFTYTLNPNGLRAKVLESDGATIDYVYDDNYRLTNETRAGSNAYDHSYEYDLVGNRVTAIRNALTENYSYDGNDRLTAAGSISYINDANGNRIEKNDGSNKTSYEYDFDNRLTRSVAPNGGVTSYLYDAEGNRVEKTDETGVTTQYVLDIHSNTGLVQVLEEKDGAGDVVVNYTYGHDLLFQTRAGDQSFYHYDGLGSARDLSDLNELVTDTYLYDAYGREVASSGTTENVYRYTGERFDPNVGLYYLRARYYDQNVGRFITTDPQVGDPQSPTSLHKYLYANNNPVNFTDPTGRFSLISISISISINTNIRSVYTQNLVKFFLKALKIAYCTLEPAYQLQALGLQMIASNVPGGELITMQARDLIAKGYQAIGKEIGAMYEAIANDLVSVKTEVGGLLGDLYNSYSSGDIPVPVPDSVAQLIEFKNELDGFLGDFEDALKNIETLINGSNCEKFTLLADKADDIAGKIPDF